MRIIISSKDSIQNFLFESLPYCSNIKTFDLSTLYTTKSNPHSQLEMKTTRYMNSVRSKLLSEFTFIKNTESQYLKANDL